MLGDDDFYIFMIWNKSFVSTNKIYDLKKNVLFEDKDITVKLEGEHEGLAEFLKTAKDMVKQKSYTYGNYGGYSGYSGNRPPYSGAPYNPLPGSKKMRRMTKTARSLIRNQSKNPKRPRSRAQESVQVGRGRIAVSSPCGMKTMMVPYIPMAATATSILEVSNNGNGFVQKLRVFPA